MTGAEWGYLAGVVLVILALRWLRRLFWVFSLLVLPGTFAHESLHYLMGLLLNGGPQDFSLLPRREGRGWVMGSVSFSRLRWYNAFFVGMAPLLLLPAACALALWQLRGHRGLGWQEALAIYVIATFLHAALPSWQDVKLAARSPIGWLLLAAGLAWGWRLLDQGSPVPPAAAAR